MGEPSTLPSQLGPAARSARIERDALLRAHDFDAAPFAIAWEVTRACAYSCVHCRADAQPKRDPRELDTLAAHGVKVNVTAMMTLKQVEAAAEAVKDAPGAFLSIFAGRIADTGRDPVPMMAAAVELLRPYPGLELIWASPRELLNIFQADAIGCHIITVTNDVLKKLNLVGKDLSDFSLDTVKMFYEDARKAGFQL